MRPGDRLLWKPFKLDALLVEVATLLKVEPRKPLGRQNERVMDIRQGSADIRQNDH
jgi:hypothetical protein